MNFDMDKEYLKFIIPTGHKAGLMHLYGDLRRALICAYNWNLKPILPVWWMMGRWQSGKRKYSNFTEYYDFNRLTINKRKIECIYDETDLDINLIKCAYPCLDWPGNQLFPIKTENYDYFLPKSPFVIEESKKVYRTIGHEFGVIHIRRTDKITNPNASRGGYDVSHYDTATRPKNIIETLKNTNAPKKIYMMTDESKDSDIIKDLQKNADFDFYFYFMFDDLVKIKEEDNYLLFAIESNLSVCNNNYYFKFSNDFCKNLENKK